MAAGDPDPERARPDDKLKGRGELDRLAVYSGVHRRGSTHLETCRGPGSTGALASTRGVEDDDPELPAVAYTSDDSRPGFVRMGFLPITRFTLWFAAG